MKNINWSVRLKNKNFWLAIIPALILFVQAGALVFGYSLDLGNLGNNLLVLVNTAFGVLVVLGIVIDPTTKGISDSADAMKYTEPKNQLKFEEENKDE